MKHSTRDWLAAWILAIAMLAAIAVAGIPTAHGNHPSSYVVEVTRSRLLLADPFDKRMTVDRDEPLQDPQESPFSGTPEPAQDLPFGHAGC